MRGRDKTGRAERQRWSVPHATRRKTRPGSGSPPRHRPRPRTRIGPRWPYSGPYTTRSDRRCVFEAVRFEELGLLVASTATCDYRLSNVQLLPLIPDDLAGRSSRQKVQACGVWRQISAVALFQPAGPLPTCKGTFVARSRKRLDVETVERAFEPASQATSSQARSRLSRAVCVAQFLHRPPVAGWHRCLPRGGWCQ